MFEEFADYFPRYIRTIELVGAGIRYVPLLPPPDGDKRTHEAAEWKFDLNTLESAVTPKTKAIVSHLIAICGT